MLLANSRVARVIKGEQNFTIFHALVKDWNLPTRKCAKFSATGLQVRLQSEYEYLNNAPDPPIIVDHLKFKNIEECFEQLELPESTRRDVWKTLIGILEIGNLKFRWNCASDKAEIDNMEQLKLVSKLIGIENVEGLEAALTTQTIKDQCRYLSINQVCGNRDSIAKLIYDKLFDYLVILVNDVLARHQKTSDFPNNPRNQSRQINIWDMYGFEQEKINSFDQLCINYANECLQQLFSQQTIIKEQELYRCEGLEGCVFDDVATVTAIQENQEIIRFMDGSNNNRRSSHLSPSPLAPHEGLFSLLNDLGMLSTNPRPSNQDQQLVDSIVALQSKKFKRTVPPGSLILPPLCFAVNHTFQPVTYTSTVRKYH